MVRKKLDNRIRVLIENCVILHHRSLFVVVGEKGRDAIPILHEMLSKAEVKARPSVLWCYKKDLGFSTNKKKQKRLRKAAAAQNKQYLDENDSIEYFIASTNIRYCYYSETHSIMGQTFGMAILQDFEALTPNLLARTIETVEGGGMILILLQTITSIKQLYTMAMDVHARYRTEAHQNVVCRFNERFILSLAKCSNCLFLDDKLNILPIKSNALNIKPLPRRSWDAPKTRAEERMDELKSSLDTSDLILNALVKKCKTYDQAEVVIAFIGSLSRMTVNWTYTLTAARGRGKSAALGLAVAAAIAYKYPNIAVTSPHPENLKTFFRFLLEGLDALGYEKSTDYEEVRSTEPEFNKAIIQVNVNRKICQRVRYIPPNTPKLDNAELLVIDEAAAIPLPFVKALLGPYLVFMASTIHGYEGTGRSLSIKLLAQFRKSIVFAEPDEPLDPQHRALKGRKYCLLELNESIRYKRGDKVEEWLNNVLCLNASSLLSSTRKYGPSPDDCKLCYVNRDALFSYHKDAEKFLHDIVGILVESHYKNSPNDLQIMSDAPAHHIFCLCAPEEEKEDKDTELPQVLCVMQVCLEGKISENTVKHELSHGRRGAGDLIPWTISQEFTQEDFPSLSGARIVRIAVPLDYQGQGYGQAALKKLEEFYEGKYYKSQSTCINMEPLVFNEDEMIEDVLTERLKSQASLPTLFPPLTEMKPDLLDYLGVSYGLSEELLRFWKRSDFSPVYLSYIPNQLTGEHACIMLKQLKGSATTSMWLPSFEIDFTFKTIETIQLLKLDTSLALDLISHDISEDEIPSLSQFEILNYLEKDEIDYLESYCSNSKFGFPVRQNVLQLTKFYFNHRVKDVSLTYTQKIVLFSYGIMLKTLEQIAKQLYMSTQQVLDQLNAGLRKIATSVVDICKN